MFGCSCLGSDQARAASPPIPAARIPALFPVLLLSWAVHAGGQIVITPACPTGYLLINSACVTCLQYEGIVCAANSYLYGCSSAASTPGVCAQCASCATGYYRIGCGALSPGYCDFCSNKATNQYYTTPGVTTSSCPFAACPAGTYTNDIHATACTPVGPGYYVATAGASALPCAVGTYTAVQGSTSCPYGCVAGTYGTGIGLTSPSTACPFQCDLGTFSTATLGASGCTPCTAGTYSSAVGATACINCPSGTYGVMVRYTSASAACVACVSACGAGTYLDGCAGTSAGVCVGCPVGTASFSTAATSASVCRQCAPGMYAPSTGLQGCLQCGSGSYSVTTGQSVCLLCPAGMYGPVPGQYDLAHACSSCPSGMYGTVAGATAVSTGCLTCNNMNCAAGTYVASCAGAFPGYCSGCVSCALGQYNGACAGTSAGACTACPAGTVASQAGQFSVTSGCATCVSPCIIYGQWATLCASGQCSWCTNAVSGQYYGSAGSATSLCPIVNTPVGYYRPFASTRWPLSFVLDPAMFDTQIALSSLTPAFAYVSLYNSVPCFTNSAGIYLWYRDWRWNLAMGGCGIIWYFTPTAMGTYTSYAVYPSGETDMSMIINWNQPLGTMVLACGAGTYNPVVGATSAAACLPCPAGTYGTGIGQTSMAQGCAGLCAAGSYSLTSGATDSSVCVQCGSGTYGTAAGAGSAAAGCGLLCAPGTYGAQAGATSAAAACTACPGGTWGNVSGAPSFAGGCPGICPSGTFSSTLSGQTAQAGACSLCLPCMPGTMQIMACGNPAQVLCGFVQAPYYVSYTNPVSTAKYLSPTNPLVGTVAFQLLVPSSFPQVTAVGPSYTVVILSPTAYSWQYILTPPSYYTLNTLLPCPTPLPTGRVFVPWFPPIQSSSCTSCVGLVPQCDLKASTQCMGGITARSGGATVLSMGYYLGADNVTCLPCSNSSTTPPCGWGQYGNTSACSNVSNTQCAPCWGASLPANAQWVAPMPPYYYYGAPNCTWECNQGYYKDASGTTCAACYLPAYATFLPGDATAQNFVFQYAGGPSRLIGGSRLYGCMVACQAGMFVGYSLTSAGAYDPQSLACLPCGTLSCPVGQIPVNRLNACPTCGTCNASNNVTANSNFYLPGSCATQCNAGFTLAANGTCALCATTGQNCTTGQYLKGCTPTAGPTCTPCSAACGAGTYTAYACNRTNDVQCAPCNSSIVVIGGAVGPECRPYCSFGYAYKASTSTCTACATSPQSCSPDTLFVPCDGVNFGCAPCNITVPLAKAWCWTGVPGSCTWSYQGVGVTCTLVPPTTTTTSPRTTTTMLITTTTATPTTTVVTTRTTTAPNTTAVTTSTTAAPTTTFVPTSTIMAPTTTLVTASITPTTTLVTTSTIVAPITTLVTTTALTNTQSPIPATSVTTTTAVPTTTPAVMTGTTVTTAAPATPTATTEAGAQMTTTMLLADSSSSTPATSAATTAPTAAPSAATTGGESTTIFSSSSVSTPYSSSYSYYTGNATTTTTGASASLTSTSLTSSSAAAVTGTSTASTASSYETSLSSTSTTTTNGQDPVQTNAFVSTTSVTATTGSESVLVPSPSSTIAHTSSSVATPSKTTSTQYTASGTIPTTASIASTQAIIAVTATSENSNTTIAPPPSAPAALTTTAVVGIASGAGVIAVVGSGLLFSGQLIKLFW